MKNLHLGLCIIFIFYAGPVFGADGGMPQLNPEYWASQAFWLILIFSVLYLVIWKIFLPKITNSIENRKSKIINDLNDAQKLKENAEKKLGEYNKIIEDAKKEAKIIIEENKKKLDSDIESKKEKFNEEIERELVNAEQEIKKLKKSSISNIKSIAVEISHELIKELLKTEMNISKLTATVEDVSKKKMEKYL